VAIKSLFTICNADPPSIVGIAEVVREAYPDLTRHSIQRTRITIQKAHEPKPVWDMGDIRLRRNFRLLPFL
jgi:predicted RNA-binding protein with PUA-like domain